MAEPRDGSKDDVARILEAIVFLYTESRRATKEVAREHGLTGPQVTAIKMLEGFGDLSLSALSARMSARNSTITGIVDRMQRDGLVERVRSEDDRRVTLIRLTPRGAALARAIPIEPMKIFERALAALAPADRSTLRRILREMSEAVARIVNEASGGERWPSKTR